MAVAHHERRGEAVRGDVRGGVPAGARAGRDRHDEQLDGERRGEQPRGVKPQRGERGEPPAHGECGEEREEHTGDDDHVFRVGLRILYFSPGGLEPINSA